MDIGQHYGVSPALDEKNKVEGEEINSQPMTTGGAGGRAESPCGFWVAELLSPDDGNPTGYVVGCVGIGECVQKNLAVP